MYSYVFLGKTKDVRWRVEQLKAFDRFDMVCSELVLVLVFVERMLVENENTFVAALKTDLNKPLQESIMTEIDFLRNDIIAILRSIHTWTKDQYVVGCSQHLKMINRYCRECEASPTSALDKAFIHPEPYGVALVMGAWNYPLQLR